MQQKRTHESSVEQMSLWPLFPGGGDAFVQGVYRYWLQRWWGPERKVLLWVLLNPSWADGQQNDRTLLRLRSFTAREGYQRLEVVNLFALRSQDPTALKQSEDPVGPETDFYIRQAITRADKTIVGWGNGPFHPKDSFFHSRVCTVLNFFQCPLWCFGHTQRGAPLHPLYLQGDKELELYRWKTHNYPDVTSKQEKDAA